MLTGFAKEILPINIEEEMKQSYLDYAMSVIVGRALPDVRDGLKPVHRRVLFAMSELGNEWNKPYKKSARVVGDVIGKYHPHGDTAVYDTIVRMAQPFSLRYMLVDGQGNFGSVDGDAPAAMRYTEVRMSRIAHEMLVDLDKDTVNFTLNYDESEREPSVLPARIPNLLINGSSGIAVGMATNIPPHNLIEIVNACVALIDNPALSITGLMDHVPGPDFPTAGFINGARGIYDAYHTGRGRVHVRARTEIEIDEKRGGRQSIIVTELPYQVNKARLLEKIAELVKDKKLDGISELRDESDKDGMRMVIELKRGEMSEVVLNNLFQHTQMQSVFGINMVALVDGRPRVLNLKDIIEAFIRHRCEVVTRRTVFELRRARERAHVLEGLAVALANIDAIIALIKTAVDPAAAKRALTTAAWVPGAATEMLERAGNVSRPADLAPELGLHAVGYRLSDAQAQAILDLRLQRLTGLERNKILSEYDALITIINELLKIINSHARLMEVIRAELLVIREQYGDKRRTEILTSHTDLRFEDLINVEDMVVTLSHTGYVKSQPVSDYSAQRRGGKGKSATSMKDEDFIDKLFVANSHDTILCFSSRGKVYWMKVYELPQASRGARGKPIVNLLPLEEGERISAVLPVHAFEEDKFVFMVTAGGTVKKTPLTEFSRKRTSGIIALDLRDDDQLVGVAITSGDQDILLFSSGGKVNRFPESDVRAMGRTACGVRGIRMGMDGRVIALITTAAGALAAEALIDPALDETAADAGLITADTDPVLSAAEVETGLVAIAEDAALTATVAAGTVLTATENGYGKRSPIASYPVHRRGGQGVNSIQTSTRNGCVVGAVLVNDEDEIMLITNGGVLVRTRVREISITGRSTQGVRLISLVGDEKLTGIECLIDPDDGAGGGLPGMSAANGHAAEPADADAIAEHGFDDPGAAGDDAGDNAAHDSDADGAGDSGLH